MLFRETGAVYCQKQTEPTNSLCGRKVAELLGGNSKIVFRSVTRSGFVDRCQHYERLSCCSVEK